MRKVSIKDSKIPNGEREPNLTFYGSREQVKFFQEIIKNSVIFQRKKE